MDRRDLEDGYEDSNHSIDNDIDAMEEEDEDDEEEEDVDDDDEDDDAESPDNEEEVAEDSHEEEEEEEEEEVPRGRGGKDGADSDSDSNSIATSDAMSANDVDTSDLSENEYDQRSDMLSKEAKKIEDYYHLVREAYRCEKMRHYEELQLDLEEERVPEFNQPLEELNEKKEERVAIGEELRKYRNHYALVQHTANIEILEQNLNNEKNTLKDAIREEINEAIRKLNEEFIRPDKEDFFYEASFNKRNSGRKHSLNSSLYGDEAYGGSESGTGNKRPKKPVTVTGPYIIYRLTDEEILKDLNYMSTCVSRPNKPYHHRHHRGYLNSYTY